ncbi:hypothetical protein M1M40_gp36 [Halorubrum tailed virus 29]|uniref:Uncharacterized protein n=1 Tax=Halorubrum tailed virus 29 TaxID=2878010 RepID=A0AAE8Y0R0_9CAUD|nr:hypothetical protein M1M40_gp36 [Halorubrum tailed virus 29]UBF23314.1 hypothetical protein HRTV-29_gp36 [Halorubrum tailed virus 29]
MPFGEYEDFDACVRENSDKRDPEAYCATIKRQIEGASALSDADRDAIKAADGFSDRLLDDDPCWDDYTMVGTKVENGQVVPNCVPDDEVPDANLAAADERCGGGMVKIGDRCVPVEDASESVDAPASILSENASYLTLKSLESEPIERVEAGDSEVRYTNVKLLSPGIWADAGSQTETYYPPDGIASLQADYDEAEHDGPPLNIMHDLDTDEWKAHEASVAGHIDPDSLDTDDDGNLFGDLVLNTAKGAGQFADDNLKSTLKNEGTVGFGGPSVEIPARGLQQSHDPQRDMPRVDGGLLTGVALVMDPASKSVNFARESARRPIAMSGTNAKALVRQSTGMAPKILEADPGEVREILDMFGLDTDDLDDSEVMDMAEDLHGDLMDELEGDDTEMGDYEDDEEDDDTEMEEHGDEDEDDDEMEMADDMDAVMDRVQNLSSRLEDLEDMVAQAMTADDVDAELEDAAGNKLADADTVEELDRRLSQLEDKGAEPRTLADSDADDDFEPVYDESAVSGTRW